jgi:hypothetical protein
MHIFGRLVHPSSARVCGATERRHIKVFGPFVRCDRGATREYPCKPLQVSCPFDLVLRRLCIGLCCRHGSIVRASVDSSESKTIAVRCANRHGEVLSRARSRKGREVRVSRMSGVTKIYAPSRRGQSKTHIDIGDVIRTLARYHDSDSLHRLHETGQLRVV